MFSVSVSPDSSPSLSLFASVTFVIGSLCLSRVGRQAPSSLSVFLPTPVSGSVSLCVYRPPRRLSLSLVSLRLYLTSFPRPSPSLSCLFTVRLLGPFYPVLSVVSRLFGSRV